MPIIHRANPLAPPRNATQDGYPVPFGNGVLFCAYDIATQILNLLQAAVNALGTGSLSIVDGIAVGDYIGFAINPPPGTPPLPTDESIWEIKGSFTLKAPVQIQTAQGIQTVPAGSVIQVSECCGQMSARGTTWGLSPLDKNTIQLNGGTANAINLAVVTSLAFLITAPEGSPVAQAYWIAPTA